VRFPEASLGPGNPKRGEFVLRSYDIEQKLRTGFVVGNDQGDVRDTVVDKVSGGASKSSSVYKDFHVNLGTGNRIIRVSFEIADGDTDVQWGDPDEPAGTAFNATGQDVYERMQVFERFAASTTEDSDRPIELEFGGYSPNGIFNEGDLNEDKLNVVLENPTMNWRAREEPSMATGELTFVETVSADAVVSSVESAIRDATDSLDDINFL